MRDLNADILVALLFQIKSVKSLSDHFPPPLQYTISAVHADLSTGIEKVLASEDRLSYANGLADLYQTVKTIQQNLKVFEELNIKLHKLATLLELMNTSKNV